MASQRSWAEEEVALRAQWEREVLPKLEGDPEALRIVRALFQAVSEDRLEHVTIDFEALRVSKRDFAEERRKCFEDWYRGLGFSDLVVPKPMASNRQMRERAKAGQALVYVAGTTREWYEKFMGAVGQGGHWTVAHEDRHNIQWEIDLPTNGYWLWVEVSPACPRRGTPWDALNAIQAPQRLLALVEYAVTWWAMKAQGTVLDVVPTWCWLRTRYEFSPGQLGALSALGGGGGVCVDRGEPEGLGQTFDSDGGRLAEVVQANPVA